VGKKEKTMKNSLEDPIYIVDDDQGILESFDAMLGDDYHLVMIDNGTEAIQKLGDQNPSLLFLDIKIPGRNGLEVLANLREKGIDTRVVVVTALAQDHYQDTAEKYGVYKYLHKPLDVDEIQEIARDVVN
jgi:two-component system response regulator AtoC